MDEPWQLPAVAGHSRRLLASFRRWLGRELCAGAGAEAVARDLYHAPFVVVSHGGDADPIFNYANLAAQRLWELPWDGFVRLPSRRSAEPEQGPAREQLLARAARDGFVTDYRGVRISASGRRFTIDDAILWNVLDEAGGRCGQAATFDHWTFLG